MSGEELANGPSGASERELLVNVAAESWRFARLFGRVLSKLDVGDVPRYANQLRYYLKSLDEHLQAADLKIVSLEGHAYAPGMAASANLKNSRLTDAVIVHQMIEPLVIGAARRSF
jgi:hypothetical protein